MWRRPLSRAAIEDVGQVATGEPGGPPGNGVEAGSASQRLVPGVDREDGPPAPLVWRIHEQPAVEASRPQEGGVEHIGAVGSPEDQDAGGGVEAVHLQKKLVERALPFLLAAGGLPGAGPPNGVELVGQDNLRRLLPAWANTWRTPWAPTPT